MQNFIINVMANYGYLGVFFLIFIENIFPPIPSEVILLFGGFMTTYANLNIYLMIIASTLGSVVGAVFLYYLGKILNKERIKKVVNSKVGKVLRLKENDILASYNWFERKGSKAVFFCRFVPIVRSLISIPAGMNEMDIPKFLLYTTIGSIIWNTVLLFLGSILGANWNTVLDFFKNYSSIVKITLILLLFYYIIKKIKNRNKIIVVKEFD